MRRRSRLFGLISVVFAFTLIAAACGDDDEGDDTSAGGTSTTVSTMAPEDVPEGGTLVVGAEQEPDCTDWIASCAGASWGYWTMNVTTLPRAFAVAKEGDNWVYVPTDLVTDEPTLEEGDKPVVTYNINPDAKWSDGTPITSSDFKYTWDQIVNGDDIYDATGYVNIESVDDSDPQTAVVTFSEPYATWQALFGGGYGILPSHILEGQDRAALMANGYDFSGGPWKIETWEKGVEAVLVPNENYWGDKPKLEKVVFRFVTDTAAEFQAFKAGEVSVIYPQPQIDAVEQIQAGLPDANSQFSTETGNFEAFWINNAAPPFDDVNVRQAFAYSIDRDAIVERLFGALGVTEALQVINAPIMSFYSDTEAFAGYTKDLGKVDELMAESGYEKGSDGFWAKDGEKITLTIKTTAGNKRRELTEQVLQEQLKEAGFDLQIDNQQAGDLFGQILPAGEFQLGLYAQVLTSLDPGVCNLFCSKNIPSEANENSGQNWTRTDVAELDPLLETVDSSLDDDERAEARKQADAIMAEEMISLPLDPLPNILLWNKSVVGPVEDNPIMGPFWNIHQWGIES